WPLEIILRRVVVNGSLIVVDAKGDQFQFGDGSGPPVKIRFTSRATERAVAYDPQLALGEAYMDGRLIVEQGNVYDLLDLLMRDTAAQTPARWVALLDILRRGCRRLHQFNPVGRAQRNVAHHYN